MEHDGVFDLELTVLELTFKHLLRKESVLHLCLLQRQTDLRLGPRGLHNVQPFLTRLLISRCEHFYLVATLQLVTDGHHFAVDASARTRIAHFRVNMISEIEHSSPHREFQQVALRREDEHLVLIEVHLKLVHCLQTVGVLQHRADIREPFVETRLPLHALIAPMGCHTPFCNLVHTFCTDLYLHPLLFRTEHGDMQTFVAVRLRHAKPVTQAFGIRLVHIRHYRVRLPTLHLLHLLRTVDDDTDGKEIIHAFERTLLLLHFLPDGVYRLCTAFDMALDASRFYFLLDRFDEAVDIGIARGLRLVQFLADMIISLILQIFQRQILQLTLQFVEAKLVGQRSIEIGSLLTHSFHE